MKRLSIMAAGVSVAAFGATVYAAAPAKAPPPPPPIANYWMDAATVGGFGGMMGSGSRPSMAQMMGMMSGKSPAYSHTLELRLASRTKAPAAPEANHLIPPGLQMGPTLPLITPATPHASTQTYPYRQPKGRMVIYWGCGEHVAPGQPTVIDFAKAAAGQVPPGMAVAQVPHSAPGYGEWPNTKDRRPVPVNGSLVGAHKVEGNYSPPIGFTLGQDFMPALNLRETGALPSGAVQLGWTPAPSATGYALAMFGAGQNGDVLMWSSSKSAALATMLDYISPSEVKRLIGTGHVLSPATTQCTLPSEVAKASPAGMIMMIGYGPQAYFAEAPKAPKWTATVRFKSVSSMMLGMPQMGASEMPDQQQQQPPKKKKKFGIGDVLKGAVGVPSE
jgi:hypothetical protein